MVFEIENRRVLRRQNIGWERDNAPGAASRRAMREDRQTRESREQARPNPKPSIAMLRRKELVRICEARWGLVLPDDDAGLSDVQLFADHCSASDLNILKAFCENRAPWMTAEEISGVFAQRRTQPWSSDDLAVVLHLTDADRTALGVRTIGAVDCGKATRTKRRKRLKRDLERQRRQAAGAKPHSQSLSATKPWEHENPPISKRTWERRRRAQQPLREAA
jgi:hypothetical protein